MRIAVVGSGYVGLVVGTCLAEFGNQVTCIENDPERMATLEEGRPLHFEPGLQPLMGRCIEAGRLSFSNSIAEGLGAAEVVFLAVGTPQDADGSANLGALWSAAKELGGQASAELIVVTKSTVPVGTGDHLERILAEASGQEMVVVSNPEFLKEGHAVEDFMVPDRVVVGTNSERARRVLRRLYAPVVTDRRPILFMDRCSAELTKYAANALLATKISFMNDLARLCDATGADIESIRRGVGTDPRIGNRFLYAGPGFGGSCFPKDVSALLHTGRQHGMELAIPKAVLEINERQRNLVANFILEDLGEDGRLDGVCVAVLGLAFKPETDDLRESPALVLVDRLLELGATVRGHDPKAGEAAVRHYGDRITVCESAYVAARDAHALVVMTEWRPFRQLDFALLAGAMEGDRLYDARNIWNPEVAGEAGFRYRGIGRR